MIRLGRLYRYPAVHKLWSARMSEVENRAVFGKCANPNGHGHTYVIELVVGREDVDESGRVTNPRELDRIAGTVLAPRFDHADLNKSFGPDFIPTGENLVEKVWELIEPQLSGVRLLEVEVEETPKNRFRIRHTDRRAANE
jgi:6-pyruvoyltetrahydropterin/6-carboxytetrahydropterin synthase